MTAVAAPAQAVHARLVCAAAVAVEVALYLSYRGSDASFHWLTHFLAGASVVLLLMTVQAVRTRRPVRVPLLWLLVAHLYAIVPDLLFQLGVPHEPWMDVFLGHVASHAVPGRSVTWLAAFAAALAAYLVALDRFGARPSTATPLPPTSGSASAMFRPPPDGEGRRFDTVRAIDSPVEGNA